MSFKLLEGRDISGAYVCGYYGSPFFEARLLAETFPDLPQWAGEDQGEDTAGPLRQGTLTRKPTPRRHGDRTA